MGALDPATASRLVKICGLFGSDQVGERASAALQASALVKRAGCTWAEIISPPPSAPPRPQQAQQPTANAPGVHRSLAAWALRHRAELSAWETEFLTSLQRRRKPLTARQATFLAGIVDRLRQGGAH